MKNEQYAKDDDGKVVKTQGWAVSPTNKAKKHYFRALARVWISAYILVVILSFIYFFWL